ncbi:hypothetical protein EV424DRAFT_1356082 [Suillus variegatus]|nr:hypothetical protein EV424DRAFT_1356082 [Suillus variegatus]
MHLQLNHLRRKLEVQQIGKHIRTAKDRAGGPAMKAILGGDGWANIIQYNYELFTSGPAMEGPEIGWSIDQWASHGRTGDRVGGPAMKAILGGDGWANIIRYNYELFTSGPAIEGPGGIQKKHALIYWARMCAAGIPAGPKSILEQGMTAPHTRYRRMGPDMDPTIPRSSSMMVGPLYPRPVDGPANDGQAVVPVLDGGSSGYRYQCWFSYQIYTTTEIRYHLDTTQINLSDMADKMRSNRSAEWEWPERPRSQQPVQITDPNFHTRQSRHIPW